MKKKIISILLSIIMLMGMIPFSGISVFAEAPLALELPCEHVCKTGQYRDNGDGTHSQKCDICEKYYNAEAHNFSSDVYRNNGDGTHSQKCVFCDAYSSAVAHDLAGLTYHNNGDGTHTRECACGETYGDPSAHDFTSGIYRCNGDGTYSQRCIACDEYTSASADGWSKVGYYAYDTGTNALTLQSTTSFTAVSSSLTVWNNGFYLVKDDVTVNSRVQVNGNVKLILVNGAHLTVKGGIGVSQNASLSIYAQSLSASEMGTVTVSDVEYSNAGIGGNFASIGGSVNIHGGVFDVTGGASGAGIGSGESETEDYDMETYVLTEASCGDITIYGGIITAQGGRNAAGIGGGLSASCGNINIVGGCIKSSGGAYSRSALGIGRDGLHIGSITYPAGQKPCNFDNVTYVGCVPAFGKHATCIEAGWLDAFKELTTGLYYSSMIFTADTLIGDGAALDEWMTEGGGFLPALGHNYQPYNVNGHNHRCENCGNTEVHTDNDEDGLCDGCKAAIYYYYSTITEQYEMTAVDYFCKEYKGETELEFGEWNGWYFVGEDYTVEDRIVVTDDVHLVLVNGAELKAMKGITVGKYASLTVYASTMDESKMGKLTVPGADDDCAGIGGAVGVTCGNMIFHGGSFDIRGGLRGAAIGAGKDGYSEETEDFWTGQKITEYHTVAPSECGSVLIYGGLFNLSGNEGCGIGCSLNISSLNSITINGGDFTAVYGGSGCSAIGSGYDHSECGNITINGGVFKKISSTYRGAGIGAGAASSCGNITINDCVIYEVSGGMRGAGIGAGDSSSCGSITINGGVMNVVGGTFSQFGIGSLNSCGDIRINGGVIKSYGTQYFDTYGSGPSGEGIGTRDTSASIIYADGLYHKAVEDGYNGYVYVNFEPVDGKQTGCEYPGYASCYYNHADGLYYTDLGEPDKCLIGDAAALEAWRAQGGGYVKPTGKAHRWYHSNESCHYCSLCGVTANHTDTDNDKKCDGCGIENYYYLNTSESKFEVAYLPVVPNRIKSTTRSLTGGWYAVEGDITIDSRMTVSGDVKLLLKDGAEITVKGGIGINANASLEIYDQSLDTASIGKLTVSDVDDFNAGIGGTASGSTCGDITIYGGILNVEGGDYSSGIGAGDAGNCGNVNIYGGVIFAEGGDFGAGIGGGRGCSGGNAAINGGYIRATAKYPCPNGIGTGADGSAVNVSYGDGVYHTDDGLTTYVNYEICAELAPTCLEAGHKKAFKDPSADEYYSDLPFGEATLIGDGDDLEEWQTSGDGVIAPLGHAFVQTDELTHSCSRCVEVQPHTDTDDNGKCDDCGAVMYYDYNEEMGSFEMKAVPADATVLTGNISANNYYRNEWYIIRGSVTVNSNITFIVNEKEQSSHIVLENGALFTAKEGIRACNKITFYASTLDYDKMGKIDIPNSPDYYAGIGCSWIGKNDPDIIIDGGRYEIYVENTNNAAIGGGGGLDPVSGGDITINGGYFEAVGGGHYAAAIGSGASGSCGDITINGGYFKTVIGSYPTAYGGDNGTAGAAGIGSGWGGSCGNITITGGYFNSVNTRAYGAAIGAGSNGATCGTVNITGGCFYHIVGGPYAAGIGRGYNSGDVDVNITGGIMFIEGGGTCQFLHTQYPAINSAAVTIGEGMETRDIGEGLPGVVIGTEELGGKDYVFVCPGAMPEKTFCAENGHKEYYSDMSELLFYSNQSFSYLIGGEAELKEWLADGPREYHFDIINGIKYYKDAEHTQLIGGYNDLTAWLNTPEEDGGGKLPAVGHSWKYEDDTCHKCEVCGLTEEHTDDGTGICEICSGSIMIFKNGAFNSDGFVYGLTFGLESPEDYIEVLDGFTLEYDTPVGTGAAIRATKDSKIYESCMLVIRGDVNGDSVCDVLDVVACERTANDHAELHDAYFAAADMDGDAGIDADDYSAMVNLALAQ